ncbi:RAMP superfamily CRISPR-associated protein [Micropruina sp.]|uniref:RAMP superfamily CRISPR-associated protein n=1 Tax=Micropruina sp. TaxID=2737536 RepID=UPI0039E367E5
MNGRVIIRVDLAIERPWAVGGVADTISDIDLPVLADPRGDGRGSAFLPATSLVGSLRRHLDDDHELWLGSAESSDDDPGTPSPLRCLGAVLETPESITTRMTTAIDAKRRAASQHMLREEEVVPATEVNPTIVHWFLQLDSATAGLDSLIERLSTWAPVVGRRRSSGQGDAFVRSVHCAELDLDDSAHLTWWLGARHTWDGASEADQPPGWKRADAPSPGTIQHRPERVLEIDFTVEEPLHLGCGKPIKKAGQKTVHRTGFRVPGSSWKGLFRHRVEHILRVRGYGEEECTRIVGDLFGTGRASGASKDEGERGILRFRDSDLVGSRTVERTHVAIDRVTGGALDRSGNGDGAGGALFAVEAIAPGATVKLQIDASDSPDELGVLLLEHVVRDIDDRLIGVGGLTSRGYGTLRLAKSRPTPNPVPGPVGGEAS